MSRASADRNTCTEGKRETDSRIDDFESPERIPVEDEVQIHTW